MTGNVELIRRGFTAFDEGDLATLDEIIADDIVWVSGGHNVLSGRYQGKPAVFSS